MSFNHYDQSELTALRQLGKPFAERDPGIERLLEGFTIDAMLKIDDIKRQVSFSASLDGSGQINVNLGVSHVR